MEDRHRRSVDGLESSASATALDCSIDPACWPRAAAASLESQQQRGRDSNRNGGRILAGQLRQADQVVACSSAAARRPSSGSFLRNRAHLADEPISPDRAEVVCAQGGVDQGGILGVVVRHPLLRRRRPAAPRGPVRAVPARGGCGFAPTRRRGASARSLSCCGLESTECRSSSRSGHCRQLQPDVANTPKMATAGRDRQRVEQHGHLATTALHSVLDGRLVRQVRGECGRFGRKFGEPARAVDGNRLYVAASDRAPGLLRRRPLSSLLPRGENARERWQAPPTPRLPARRRQLDRRKASPSARQTLVRLGTPVYCRTSDSGWRSGAVGSAARCAPSTPSVT